jgi:hypothetical protein
MAAGTAQPLRVTDSWPTALQNACFGRIACRHYSHQHPGARVAVRVELHCLHDRDGLPDHDDGSLLFFAQADEPEHRFGGAFLSLSGCIIKTFSRVFYIAPLFAWEVCAVHERV